MFVGHALSFLLRFHDHAAVVPERIGGPQLQHNTVVQRQTVGDLNADRTAADHLLQYDQRQLILTQFLSAISINRSVN